MAPCTHCRNATRGGYQGYLSPSIFTNMVMAVLFGFGKYHLGSFCEIAIARFLQRHNPSLKPGTRHPSTALLGRTRGGGGRRGGEITLCHEWGDTIQSARMVRGKGTSDQHTPCPHKPIYRTLDPKLLPLTRCATPCGPTLPARNHSGYSNTSLSQTRWNSKHGSPNGNRISVVSLSVRLIGI